MSGDHPAHGTITHACKSVMLAMASCFAPWLRFQARAWSAVAWHRNAVIVRLACSRVALIRPRLALAGALMELTYAELSSPGPGSAQQRGLRRLLAAGRRRGAADARGGGGARRRGGRPGPGRSRQPPGRRDGPAQAFARLKPDTSPRQALWQLFTAANLAVYDQGMDQPRRGPHGHHAHHLAVPQQRSHHRPRGRLPRRTCAGRAGIRQITADHSYAAMQVEAGPDLGPGGRHQRNALRCSPAASARSPTVQVDYYTVQVNQRRPPGAVFRRPAPCVTEEEIGEIVTPRAAGRCLPELVALAEKRGHRRQSLGAGRRRSTASNR